MDRGTYAAASSGMAQLVKLQVVTNNLANVSTPGYKRQALVGKEQTFEETLASRIAPEDQYAKGDHARTPGVSSVSTVTDFSVGPTHTTGNPLDLALKNSNDFFVVNTPNGERYTKAGNFTLNESGQIVTSDGLPVLGSGGPLTVTEGGMLSFSAGGVLTVDGESLGTVRVVRFEDTSGLSRESAVRFRSTGAEPTQVPPEVVPFSLEQSNVSAVNSMIDLITASRGFEQYTKAAKAIEKMNQQSITKLGSR